jgi:hypothetical protein
MTQTLYAHMYKGEKKKIKFKKKLPTFLPPIIQQIHKLFFYLFIFPEPAFKDFEIILDKCFINLV